MKKIAIIDADLIGRKRHRFPNLTCMKISGFYKNLGAKVELKTDYENLSEFGKIYIAKVFTETPIDSEILKLPNVKYGGTGFFYDKAEPLPNKIEHSMPDYHLYDEWVKLRDKGGTEFKAYKDYSIGFLTRGCFRHCAFCVNRRSSEVKRHSPLKEFLDETRKKICLLDDNFLGCADWKILLQELIDTGKPFCFKQGLDVRLLDEERAELLFNARYDGDLIFAFDNVNDSEVIEEKLKLIQKFGKKNIKFYVFCGFDRNGKYDKNFWQNDFKDLFTRIEILGKYGAKPYIMRHENYLKSPYQGMYKNIAAWCNQPFLFRKKTLKEVSFARGISAEKYFVEFERDNPLLTHFLEKVF